MAKVKANGINIEIETFGKPTDPAVLMVMGFSAQMTMWPEPFCQGIADRGFYVIRFDNRDIGLSDKMDHFGPPDIGAAFVAIQSGKPYANAPYRLEDKAADAAGVLDALNISRAHIVGASMGGMIAQLFAVYHGHRTMSMTSIMSTTGRPGLKQASPEVAMALMTPPPGTDRDSRIKHVKQLWTLIGSPGYRATPAELQAVAEREVDRSTYDGAAIGRQLTAIVGSSPRHEILRAVTCPVLVLHGVDDPLIPIEGGRDTAAAIPGAKLVEIPGMGHDFTESLVPIYLREIGGFLVDAEKRRKALEAEAATRSSGFAVSGEG